MNEEEKILNTMETEKIWRYSTLAEAIGIKTNAMNRYMPKLVRSGKVVRKADGKTAYYALRKYADELIREVEYNHLPDEYKAFISHSKRYDQCFAKYMHWKGIKAADEKQKSIARLMKPQGTVWAVGAV